MTELQRDIFSLGLCPPVNSPGRISEAKHATHLYNIKIELVEYNENVLSDVDNIDGLIVVIPSNDLFGIESHRLWNWAISTGLPCIAFVSKIDLLLRASKYLKSIQNKLKNTIPVNQEYLYAAASKSSSGTASGKATAGSFPLLFGSTAIKIGIFDLMKTIVQCVIPAATKKNIQ